MHWQHDLYAVCALIAAIIAAALALFGWRRRSVLGAKWFVALMLSITWWAAFDGIELLYQDLPNKTTLMKITFVGVNTAPIAWLALTLSYTGRERWLTRRNMSVLLLISLSILAFVWTNERHEWFWANVRLDTSGSLTVRTFTPGPLYWVNVFYLYGMLLFSAIHLIVTLLRSLNLYRSQLSVLLIALVIPLSANVLYNAGVFPVAQVVSISFAISGLVVAWGLFRFRLLDIVPVAREIIFESMDDIAIVLDNSNRVIDINPAAQRSFGWNQAEVVGQLIENVLTSRQLEVTEQHTDTREIQIETVIEGHTYDMRLSPLFRRGGQLIGRLVILHDVTERVRLIKELDAFAHTVAHDLKNPLGSIMGYAGMLVAMSEAMSTDTIQQYLRTIEHTAVRMDNILEALLLLAGVRKVQEVQTSPLDMASIIEEVQRRLAYMIETHQAEIAMPRTWPAAMGYAPWVQEVWVNYISNALKYGGNPPHVELGASVESDSVARFWVKDNGAGLSPEDQAKLFTPFTRIGEAKVEGHGLGLSIVQRIVEKLGGEVGVESAVDAGSTFSFTLPTD